MITLGVFALLLLVCCGLVYFVAIPQGRDMLDTDVAEGLGTKIASQLPAGELPPDTYHISLGDLERDLNTILGTQNVQAVSLVTVGDRLELRVETDANQSAVYSGRPVAENGRLVMQEMSVNNDLAEFLYPADRLGEVLEQGVNDYFAARGLQVSGVELRGDEIVVEATG